METHIVIMAGGIGSRFWPMSTPECHKQFIDVYKRQIESVLEQDYPYIEYIVVDGASKDNSLAVINEYKNGIDTIISEPDKGCPLYTSEWLAPRWQANGYLKTNLFRSSEMQ